ncbi:MAG: sodium:proton antiporter [Deltaproteobacteria bacterium]|nr:sodium:proton antiporter [Deltaproteobacteria bacterium]
MDSANIESLPWLLLAPFFSLLIAIGIFPLLLHKLWEKNLFRLALSLGLSLPVVAFFLKQGQWEPLGHSLHEYLSFILLIGSLYVVSGGLYIEGSLGGSAFKNTGLLALGGLLANLIGTTGASMLLIRPFLRANLEKPEHFHRPLFFILVVSNTGGLLTPLGDPPLFLGYLKGVPFAWTLHLFPVWASVLLPLLVIFYFWEKYLESRSPLPQVIPLENQRAFGLEGKINLLYFALILGSLFLDSPLRELGLALSLGLSLMTTSRKVREKNHFSFEPLWEVAILFFGIFLTMTPAMLKLKAIGPSLAIDSPKPFFWLTGTLSAFLDNAPTYLTFFSLAQGLPSQGNLVASVQENLLMAISSGAVLFGALSYIGNGPNFMVKAIADAQGFKTLGFFSYLIYAALILLPLYAMVSWIYW